MFWVQNLIESGKMFFKDFEKKCSLLMRNKNMQGGVLFNFPFDESRNLFLDFSMSCEISKLNEWIHIQWDLRGYTKMHLRIYPFTDMEMHFQTSFWKKWVCLTCNVFFMYIWRVWKCISKIWEWRRRVSKGWSFIPWGGKSNPLKLLSSWA